MSDEENSDGENNKQVLSDLRIKRGVVQMQMTKMKKFIETPGRSLTLAELQTRLGLVEDFWHKFENFQTELECIDADEQTSDKREVFQESFITVKSKILELIEPKTTVPRSPGITLDSSSPGKKNVRLPKLSIKKFSGRYLDWPDFYAKFKTLIENDSELSNVEKMAYLQESLEEKPLTLISNLSLERDFAAAIATLKARYENKQLILQGYIREIVEVKAVDRQSEVQLRSMIDTVRSSLRALNNFASQKEIFEGLLIHLMRSKIDSVSRMKWEEEVPAGEYPTWDEFSSFIERRCRALENSNSLKEASTLSMSTSKTSPLNVNKGFKTQFRKSFVISKANHCCSFCGHTQHFIDNCEKFLKLSPAQRFHEAKAINLCIQCLEPGHRVQCCRELLCQECNQRHHTLLHFGGSQDSVRNVSAHVTSQLTDLNSNVPQGGIALTSHSLKGSVKVTSETVLATAVVLVKNSSGDYTACRALLDSGSSLNFVAERVAQHLRLKKVRSDIEISGISSTTMAVKYKTNVALKSRVNHYSASIEAYILPRITGNQPCCYVTNANWKIPDNVVLADPSYNVPQPIDLLIGANLFFELLSVGQIKLGNGLPILQKTVLGWIISGGKSDRVGSALHAVESASELSNLEDLVQRFWAIDNPEPKSKLLSPEQQACEDHFVENVKRDHTGRFSVTLPFHKSRKELGVSLNIAKKRFFNLENKLLRSPELKKQYSAFMLEYMNLGHMERVQFQEIPQNNYFIPHHCILKPESSSTRLRAVFDASCKTSSGMSLNDILMVGPVIQDDLYDLIIRFRSHKYVLTADISKMYRQITVRHPDTNFQCILWRSDTQRPVEAYRLLTLTYGTSPASFIATRCLKQLALDGRNLFPTGSSIVEHDFYVDDMLTGADSLQEAITIQKEVMELLSSGGFFLSKWCSNAPELLQNIDEGAREKYLCINGDNVIKTLGMIWHPDQDKFRFAYNSQEINHSRVSKRTMLAAIARLFDPIGLVCPIVTKAKIFLQHLWRLRLDWDESLPQNLQHQWLEFFKQLQAASQLKIPRYILHRSSKVEVHGFADASMDAYGCCIYIRCVVDDKIHCNLLTARSRVAPIQMQSIARLELCAALLLSETIKRVVDIFAKDISKVYCWSDSTTVLAWLASPPSRWSIFVGNRVNKIQEMTKEFMWNHIGTEKNPADIVSRGASPLELIESSLWFHGPAFLQLLEENWPEVIIDNHLEPPEERKVRVVFKVSVSENFIEAHKFCNSYLKMINMIAYIVRFVKNAKNKNRTERIGGELSFDETDNALKTIIRVLQGQQLNLHAGCQTLLAILRTRFWPIGGRATVKSAISGCIRCFKCHPKTAEQMMGQLPSYRVQPSPAFFNTGVDFCGPFYVKNPIRNRPPTKAYLCIFICMAVKAVHFEIVCDLSTAGFISALTKFMARRPFVSRIHSDNATNFIGAGRELKELKALFDSEHHNAIIRELCKRDGIDWVTIPVRSPNFGGLWESAVKQAKHLIKRAFGNESYTLDELQRVACQAESIMNSRPITPISNDANDLEFLTPGHFVTGGMMRSIPSPSLREVQTSHLNRWQAIQSKVQSIWSRWSREYLQGLQSRNKWNTANPNLQLGMMVLLKDDNIPTLKWPLGRIIKLHKGEDDLVRVVTIRTANGTTTRAISKVCPLPIAEDYICLEADTSKVGGYVNTDS